MAFAERLRVLRGNSGMTQWQIAQALNISRSAYAYYETGATRPDFDTLTRLAQIFRVSTDYLLGVDENVQPVLTMNSVRPRYGQRLGRCRIPGDAQRRRTVLSDPLPPDGHGTEGQNAGFCDEPGRGTLWGHGKLIRFYSRPAGSNGFPPACFSLFRLGRFFADTVAVGKQYGTGQIKVGLFPFPGTPIFIRLVGCASKQPAARA